jgi:OPT oligopeptide transporter protein
LGVFDWFRGAGTILDHVQTLAQIKNRLPLHPHYMARRRYVLAWRITILMHLHRSISIGWLCVGINSSVTLLFVVGFACQWWLRTRYPRWFAKYNYILAAGLDGGTQVRYINIHFHINKFY